MENHMNWISVAIAAFIPMIVGFIYYNPKVLGGVWMDANGFKLENMKPPKPILYVGALVLSFMLSMWLSFNVTGPGQDVAPDGHSFITFQHGIAHGVFITLMVLFPVLGTLAIFEQKSFKWLAVNLGYWVVTLSIMGGILSNWR